MPPYTGNFKTITPFTPPLPEQKPRTIYTQREQKIVVVAAREIGPKLLVKLKHLK